MGYKWFLLVFCWLGFLSFSHPIYVSVSEIEYVPASQHVEVSCKLFTDDLEQVLRQQHPGVVIDLLNAQKHQAMRPLVETYIQTHFQLAASGQPIKLHFLDYEQDEEAIVAYLEAGSVKSFSKLEITNTMLYERSPQQMGIMHVLIQGKRSSTKLNNPDKLAVFHF